MASGSLTNLAKAPASTVQLLGAEKVLFNALKKRTNARPVVSVHPDCKGKVARSFANKISLVGRVDAFGDEFRSGGPGAILQEMIEWRVESAQTGVVTEPNLDAMERAVAETRHF
jgi:RNA processing factor Prp31